MYYDFNLFEELAITEGVQPVVDTPPETTPVETPPATEPVETPPEGETTPTDEFELDGEKVKFDDVKEWRKGYLRQSDYTKKTQEIAQQREQQKDAIELYEFLQNNPTYAQKLTELAEQEQVPVKAPVDPRVAQLDLRVTSMQIESELNEIKAADSDVDEVELLNLANEMKMPLKLAYNVWRGRNFDKLMSKKLAQSSAELTDNIAKGKQTTKTLIREGDKPTATTNFGLSAEEMKVADGMRLSYEEYAKWRE
jgi:hypothetical protein